jgi:hypothetical protein
MKTGQIAGLGGLPNDQERAIIGVIGRLADEFHGRTIIG